MARSYGKLMSSIWRNDGFKSLPDAETQLLYLALISQPDLSPCGRLTVALGRWADGIAGANRRSIMDALEALEHSRFIIVDWDNDELLVRSFVRHDNGLGNPRRRAAIKNAAQEIGSPLLRAAIKTENPGVFDDDIEDIHNLDAETVESDKTPGHSSNVQRTTPEPTVCTAMPNPGDVRREPGDVRRDPPNRELSVQRSATATDARNGADRGGGISIEAIATEAGKRYARAEAIQGSAKSETGLAKWKANQLLENRQAIATDIAEHPTATIAVLADAALGNRRGLAAFKHTPTAPEPAQHLSRAEREALITASKTDTTETA